MKSCSNLYLNHTQTLNQSPYLVFTPFPKTAAAETETAKER